MISLLHEKQLLDGQIKSYYLNQYSMSEIEKEIQNLRKNEKIFDPIDQLKELRKKNFIARDLSFYYTLKQIKDAGFSVEELIRSSFTLEELREVGFNAYQLKYVGYFYGEKVIIINNYNN